MGAQPSFACVECGEDVPVVHPGRARAVVCGSCGAQHDLFAAGAPVIDHVPIRLHRPEGLLQLGSKGTFGDKVIQVIGRLRLSTMSQGRVRLWDEWILVTQDGRYLRIQEQQGRYTILIPFEPDPLPGGAFFDETRESPTVLFNGLPATVQTSFKAKVQFVEGELTARICIGDLVEYVELDTPNDGVVCELTYDDTWCFTGDVLEDRAMWALFGYHGILAAHDALHHARARNALLARGIAQAAAVLLTFAVLGGVILGGVITSHEDISEGWARFDFSDRDQVIEEFTGVVPLHDQWGFYSLDVECGLDETSEGIELLAESPSGRRYTLVRCTHADEGVADRAATHTFRVQEAGTWRLLAIHRAEPGGDGRASFSWQLGWDLGSAWWPLLGLGALLALGLISLVLYPLSRVLGVSGLEQEFEARRAELALFLRKRFLEESADEQEPDGEAPSSPDAPGGTFG